MSLHASILDYGSDVITSDAETAPEGAATAIVHRDHVGPTRESVARVSVGDVYRRAPYALSVSSSASMKALVSAK
jgi:hypothetical protein